MNTTALVLTSVAAMLSLASAQDASPTNLAGTTLCLSQKNTVAVGIEGAGKMDLKGLADQAYAQIKSAFQKAGVKVQEAAGCTESASAFYLVFDATKENSDGTRAFLVTGSVSDWTIDRYQTYVDIWSDARYGTTSGSDADIVGGLLEDSGVVVDGFVQEWKAANPGK